MLTPPTDTDHACHIKTQPCHCASAEYPRCWFETHMTAYMCEIVRQQVFIFQVIFMTATRMHKHSKQIAQFMNWKGNVPLKSECNRIHLKTVTSFPALTLFSPQIAAVFKGLHFKELMALLYTEPLNVIIFHLAGLPLSCCLPEAMW